MYIPVSFAKIILKQIKQTCLDSVSRTPFALFSLLQPLLLLLLLVLPLPLILLLLVTLLPLELLPLPLPGACLREDPWL